MAAFVLVAAAHPDRQRHLLARAGREAVANGDEIAGDQREQVGGLGVRIDPFRPVPAVRRARRCSTGLPFDSSTGKRALSATIVVV